MVLWRVRDFHDDDLDAAIRLWGDPTAGGEAPVFGLSDLVTAVRAGEPAVVAVVGDELAGTGVATVSGGRAWIVRMSLAATWRNRGIGSAMLTELERRLVALGVHRIDCLLATSDEVGALALEHGGYRARPGMVFYEKLEPVGPEDVGILGRLGGRMLRADTWDELEGMVKEKELIERRVILPLAHAQLAGRLGVVAPRAVVLFGPPGRARPPSPKASQPGLAGRSWSCSPPGWPVNPLLALPRRCGRRSRWWPSSTGWSCSSTRWRRSPGRGSQDRPDGPGSHQRDTQAHPAVPGKG